MTNGIRRAWGGPAAAIAVLTLGTAATGLPVCAQGGEPARAVRTGPESGTAIPVVPALEGLAGVKLNGRWGFIDKAGNVWFKPESSDGAGRGYVNRRGQVVWKPRPKVVEDLPRPSAVKPE